MSKGYWFQIKSYLFVVFPMLVMCAGQVYGDTQGLIAQVHGQLAYISGLNGNVALWSHLQVVGPNGSMGGELEVIKILDDQIIACACSPDVKLIPKSVVHLMPQVEVKRSLRDIEAVSVPNGPKLDGHLDDGVWESAKPIEGFVQRDPGYWIPVSERTVARIVYDQEALYFGFECFSADMSTLVANNMRHDSEIWGDDNVQILLDTYNDRQTGFFFFINPLGAKRDLMLSDEGRSYNEDWDCNWEVKTQKYADRWTAEVKIPFDQLRFKNDGNMTWGINLARFIPSKNEESQLVVGRKSSSSRARYWMSDIGELRGLGAVQSKRLFQVKPYILPGTSRNYNVLGASEDPVFETGLDVRYGLTSNLTLDVSYNTDFAQVEGDQEQVNLSQFQLFFPEKREFFLEGSNLFDFGEAAETRGGDDKPPTILFYSRRVGLEGKRQVPILLGTKLTGKAGRTSIGALNVVTNDAQFTDPTGVTTLPKSNYSVVRLKQDVLTRSNVGFIFVNKMTDGVGNNPYNRAGGIDFSFSPSASLNVQGFVARTWDSTIGDADDARFARAVYQGSVYSSKISFLDVEEHFEPVVGFVNRRNSLPGFRRYQANARVRPRPSFENIRTISIGPEVEVFTDRNNNVKYWEAEASWWTQFESADWYRLEFRRRYDVVATGFRPSKRKPTLTIPAGTYTFNTFSTGPSTSRSRKDRLSASFEAGGYYTGKRYEISFNNTYRPSGQLALETEYEVNWLRLPQGNATIQTLSNRLIYAFNTEFFVKLFAQWNNDSQQMSANFLMSYRYRPGSDIFLVFDHGFDTQGGIEKQSRAVLLKVSYLLGL